MRDNELIQAFLPLINAGLTARDLTGVVVRQSYQPTQQGADSGPTVYFYKLFDKRYGFLERRNENRISPIRTVHIETQFYETTFQFSAWSIQDPSDTDSVTASDLVNEVAAILQGDVAREALNVLGIGILRVTDVTNPYFVDDKDRNEASPSFDLTFTHKQVYEYDIAVLTKVELNIYEV